MFSSSTITARAVKPRNAESEISTPNLFMKSRPRIKDNTVTLFNPSATQKRFIANGRSAEITSTTVFASLLAASLNLRAEVAHTAVSRLGTMLSTLRLPEKSFNATSSRFLSTRVNSGAVWPMDGNVPDSVTGVPFKVTVEVPDVFSVMFLILIREC
uniref:Uncharacterized protein n=1 Tax=Candidatus Nitrotoga fabula TaxID=2182327 RepID=A0A2X0QS94_9PROT|nr:protein of unknown function [Candidatus Nitrotoga fabula]